MVHNAIPVPRARGNAVQKGSAWGWELFITIGDSEPVCCESRQTFISRDAALTDLRWHAAEMLKTLCQEFGLPQPAGVTDLNRGVMQSVEDFKRGELSRKTEGDK